MIKTPLSTMIGGAFWTPNATIIGGTSKTFDQLIKSLFANGEQGFVYDPNDLSTMFQDAVGIVPVTTEGQPVGLIRDKSGRNNHAFQTVSASRPLLQRNATTGAYYLVFDGADDFLRTNSIDFTATDKVSLFAGVRKLSDATTGIVCETGSFYIASPTGASLPTVGIGFRVATLRTSGLNNYPAPVDMIVTAQGDTSNNVSSIRVNATDRVINNGSQGVGNYSNSVMYIGRRGGIGAAFNGHIYGLIGIGRLTTDAETLALEKLIAKNTGVALSV